MGVKGSYPFFFSSKKMENPKILSDRLIDFVKLKNSIT
jgi:hypothetical protein